MATIARRYTFKKHEKLCNVREIAELFKGKSIFVFPFKVAYKITPSTQNCVKVLCSVGKRYSKLAVKRNRSKRLLRESYRLNKHIIYDFLEDNNLSMSVNIAFIYVSQKEESYETQQEAVRKSLEKINYIIEESNS